MGPGVLCYVMGWVGFVLGFAVESWVSVLGVDYVQLGVGWVRFWGGAPMAGSGFVRRGGARVNHGFTHKFRCYEGYRVCAEGI